MVHRGPDGAGIWVSPDQTVGLAHRRLAVIDLSDSAAQPMSDTAGTLSVTFNGEIYNFIQLRRELEALGHHFRTASDTEVLIEAYRAWESACVNRLNGMFAFALYDSNRKRLFLARDRAGEKPLFYRLASDQFAFASELKALVADPHFSRRLSLEALDLYLAFGFVPGENCILQDVKKLGAGEAMTYDCLTRTVRSWRYWELPTPRTSPRPSDAELVTELETLLEDSVRLRLVADVPVGILLSGGIDSSLVTAMAARVSSAPVKTFTISFPGYDHYNEGPFARTIANYFATDHTELQAEEASVSLLPSLARQFDEPIADSSMVPTYLVSHLVSQCATVALGGDGGDELLGGYNHYNILLRQDGYRRFLPTWFRRPLGVAASHLLPPGLRGRNYLMRLAADLPESIALTNTYFDPVLRSRLLQPDITAVLRKSSVAEFFKTRLFATLGTALQNATAIDFATYLPEDILTKVDRTSMLSSLEVRAPWLDPRLIEFAFATVPDCCRATRTERKVLAKRLAQRVLPPGTDLNRKQGFSIPLSKWFVGQWGEHITEIVSNSDGHLFRRRVIKKLLNGQCQHRSNTHRLFALAMFTLWQREYHVSF
jgi:asparagine synthase (glutamine-hydrolysing)